MSACPATCRCISPCYIRTHCIQCSIAFARTNPATFRGPHVIASAAPALSDSVTAKGGGGVGWGGGRGHAHGEGGGYHQLQTVTRGSRPNRMPQLQRGWVGWGVGGAGRGGETLLDGPLLDGATRWCASAGAGQVGGQAGGRAWGGGGLGWGGSLTYLLHTKHAQHHTLNTHSTTH